LGSYRYGSELIRYAKANRKEFLHETFDNGDTRKQLLARNRHLLYKAPNSWTQNQYQRAKILFALYPDIKKAYDLVQELRDIFNNANSIQIAYTKLAHWHKNVELTGFKAFNTIANTMSLNYRSVLNYFIYRSTNPPLNLSMPKSKPLEVSSGESRTQSSFFLD
jgi:transposase